MNYKIILSVAFLVLALSVFTFFAQRPFEVLSSVPMGNDYIATSTRNFAGTALTNYTVLRKSAGTLSRVTITGANTGIMRFWNATTTNVNLRTGQTPTTTLLVIEIPASAAAGTYDFDAVFDTGIIYELVSGLAPTSTILVR